MVNQTRSVKYSISSSNTPNNPPNPPNPFASISVEALINIQGIRCPITGEVMNDPKLLVANGVSYEGTAIIAHLEANGTNPQTGELLNASQMRLLPNPFLKELIKTIMERITAN
jgi:hypothetical protein